MLFVSELMVVESSARLFPPPSTIHVDSFQTKASHMEVYSTGILEALLKSGVSPHILVPRKLTAADRWWIPLVNSKRIFLDTSKAPLPERQRNVLQQLLDAHGIPWPHNGTKLPDRIQLQTQIKIPPRPHHLRDTLKHLPRYGFLSLDEIELIARQS